MCNCAIDVDWPIGCDECIADRTAFRGLTPTQKATMLNQAKLACSNPLRDWRSKMLLTGLYKALKVY